MKTQFNRAAYLFVSIIICTTSCKGIADNEDSGGYSNADCALTYNRCVINASNKGEVATKACEAAYDRCMKNK